MDSRSTRPLPEARNLFEAVTEGSSEELIETLAGGANVRIERIVSQGHSSDPDFWYDQDENEWVVLLSGKAILRFEGHSQPVDLEPGDWIEIPAGARHRVDWTDPDGPTVWLAVFYPPPRDPSTPNRGEKR